MAGLGGIGRGTRHREGGSCIEVRELGGQHSGRHRLCDAGLALTAQGPDETEITVLCH